MVDKPDMEEEMILGWIVSILIGLLVMSTIVGSIIWLDNKGKNLTLWFVFIMVVLLGTFLFGTWIGKSLGWIDFGWIDLGGL